MDRLARLSIPADHPALPGHFPGHPVVPGVVLLDLALRAIERDCGCALLPGRLTQAKFLAPVGPGAELSVAHDAPQRDQPIRFEIRHGEIRVASGSFSPAIAP